MNESQQTRSFQSAVFTDRLSVVAMALFLTFLAYVLAFILPPRLLDPLWQIRSLRLAVESAPLPLIGLVLIHLAAYLCPENNKLQQRRQIIAQLAILASLGFFLAIPLQGQAIWASYNRTNSEANQRQANAAQQAEEVRDAIKKATSTEDLQKRLLALQRPGLRITVDPRQFPAVPLPQLKQLILSQLDKAEGQFKARVAPIAPPNSERITRETLHLMVSSLAYAIAFAACGQRKNSPVPFLVEVPSLPGRLIGSLLPRRDRPGQGSAGAGFLKSASKREEEFFESLAPPEDEEPPAR